MAQLSTKKYTPLGQFGILLAFLGAGVILTSIAQFLMMFSAAPAGLSTENMQNEMMRALKDANNVGLLRWMQAVGTFLMMFIPAWIYAKICWGKPAFWLGSNKHFDIRQILLAIVLILCANLVASSLADVSKMIVSNFPSLDAAAKRMEDSYNEQVLTMSNLKSWSEYFAAVVLMAMLPALFEEFFFRGALQNILVRWFRHGLVAIIIASIIFSAVHMSIYLFLSRVALGLALGLLYYYSKNIWISVAAHFFNNAMAVTQMWILKLNDKKIDVATLDPVIPWYAGILAIVAFVLLLKLFIKVSKEHRQRILVKEQVLLAEADPFNGWAGQPKTKEEPWV